MSPEINPTSTTIHQLHHKQYITSMISIHQLKHKQLKIPMLTTTQQLQHNQQKTFTVSISTLTTIH